ncbi:hypothetical protein [Sphingobacterium griseoflavum]|uniref:Uncharacterized protein n=1 Tax=Sphingobacterium griseoflavum TaxID=1474952 RepID=A0ABQ3HUX0_9SPHI|nr:hypothetical protein [Sphingobacterium griseoflavum]GHE37095.1 hypothetical protein GCM10017764_20390 [Sphingobacterium griseoflavum]
MKGFKLSINDHKAIMGGIQDGSTGVIVSHKDGKLQVFFNSMDKTGMLSYTWCADNLSFEDKLKISYQNIYEELSPIDVLDYTNQEEMDSVALESYYQLRDELMEEGLI